MAGTTTAWKNACFLLRLFGIATQGTISVKQQDSFCHHVLPKPPCGQHLFWFQIAQFFWQWCYNDSRMIGFYKTFETTMIVKQFSFEPCWMDHELNRPSLGCIHHGIVNHDMVAFEERVVTTAPVENEQQKMMLSILLPPA
jgi:hypothetical protein